MCNGQNFCSTLALDTVKTTPMPKGAYFFFPCEDFVFWQNAPQNEWVSEKCIFFSGSRKKNFFLNWKIFFFESKKIRCTLGRKALGDVASKLFYRSNRPHSGSLKTKFFWKTNTRSRDYSCNQTIRKR